MGRIVYLNVQGLTHSKFVELSTLLDDNKFILLNETHMKYNKIKHSNNITWINKMRDEKDKKGGGISLIYNKENNVVVNQIETNNSDILAINIENKNNKRETRTYKVKQKKY